MTPWHAILCYCTTPEYSKERNIFQYKTYLETAWTNSHTWQVVDRKKIPQTAIWSQTHKTNHLIIVFCVCVYVSSNICRKWFKMLEKTHLPWHCFDCSVLLEILAVCLTDDPVNCSVMNQRASEKKLTTIQKKQLFQLKTPETSFIPVELDNESWLPQPSLGHGGPEIKSGWHGLQGRSLRICNTEIKLWIIFGNQQCMIKDDVLDQQLTWIHSPTSWFLGC